MPWAALGRTFGPEENGTCRSSRAEKCLREGSINMSLLWSEEVCVGRQESINISSLRDEELTAQGRAVLICRPPKQKAEGRSRKSEVRSLEVSSQGQKSEVRGEQA